MARLILSYSGVSPAEGPQAAKDITAEFAQHRVWYRNVRCTWDGARLVLEADDGDDWDTNGLALMDEFSDCVSAFVKDIGDGELRVESITRASA